MVQREGTSEVVRGIAEGQMMTDDPPKPRRRWLRFSLRFVFLLVALIAIPLGWKMNRVRSQRLFVAEINKLNTVSRQNDYLTDSLSRWQYDYANRGVGTTAAPQRLGPKWIWSLIGDDFFADLESVSLYGPGVTNTTLAHAAELPCLKSLSVGSDFVTDAGLVGLKNARNLKVLYLSVPSITDAGLSHVVQLKGLESLCLSRLRITPHVLECVSRITALKYLCLGMTADTEGDVGLEDLAGLKRLEQLHLIKTNVGDAGLACLCGMPNLKSIILNDVQAVTVQGVERLRNALPNCKVEWTPHEP